MTRRERKERKLQKRLEWADSREKKANQINGEASKIASIIPLGQPILKGHHSEKRHRKDLERIRSKSSKVIEHSNMADYHRNKAEGIQYQLNHTIFSDDPDAIKQLQEKLTKLETQRERKKQINKALKKEINIDLTKKEKQELSELKKCWGDYIYPAYELTNLSANIRRTKKRIESLK